MKSLIHTGPSLIVKIAYESDAGQNEKVIGYASALSVQVQQGQKEIFTVDSPFPQEIAQGAAPSFVRGQLSFFLPKGQTPESLGLVPYRTNSASGTDAIQAGSRYFHLRIYDRLTSELVFSADWCKAGSYSIAIGARSIVRCDMQFTGMYLTPGNAR